MPSFFDLIGKKPVFGVEANHGALENVPDNDDFEERQKQITVIYVSPYEQCVSKTLPTFDAKAYFDSLYSFAVSADGTKLELEFDRYDADGDLLFTNNGCVECGNADGCIECNAPVKSKDEGVRFSVENILHKFTTEELLEEIKNRDFDLLAYALK